MKTPLLDIAMMNFRQLSDFVKISTNKQYYIALPAEASDIDCDILVEEIIKIVITPALTNQHKRVDSRSHRAQESDTILAELLASAALTYWMDRGFIISTNARITRALSSKIIEEERSQAKQDMIALQIGKIGAILGAKKCKTKDALQGFWDFEESELVLLDNKMNGGDVFGDESPRVSA